MPNNLRAYGITAIATLIAAFFVPGSIDIAFHDTYIVVTNSHLLVAISLLYLLFLLGTYLANGIATKWIIISGWMHYSITTLGFLGLLLLLNSTPGQQNDQDYSVYNEFSYQENVIYPVVMIAIVVISVQLIWIFNVIRGVISRMGRKSI